MTDKALGRDDIPAAPYGVMYGFPSEDEMFCIGLYELCLSMIMAASGSADGMTDDEFSHRIGYLRKRLESWKEPTSKWDAAVRDMVRAALSQLCEEAS
jgi:hypothetical protein